MGVTKLNLKLCKISNFTESIEHRFHIWYHRHILQVSQLAKYERELKNVTFVL